MDHRPVPVSRLARVLAEGLVHIAERRAAEEAVRRAKLAVVIGGKEGKAA